MRIIVTSLFPSEIHSSVFPVIPLASYVKAKRLCGTLAKALAKSKYISVSFPQRGAIWCTKKRSKVSIFLVIATTLVTTFLNLATLTIKVQFPSNCTLLYLNGSLVPTNDNIVSDTDANDLICIILPDDNSNDDDSGGDSVGGGGGGGGVSLGIRDNIAIGCEILCDWNATDSCQCSESLGNLTLASHSMMTSSSSSSSLSLHSLSSSSSSSSSSSTSPSQTREKMISIIIDDSNFDELTSPQLSTLLHPRSGSPEATTTTATTTTTTATTTATVTSANFKTSTGPEIMLTNLNFWVQAVLVKIIPCIGMVILSLLLKRKMTSAQRKRRQLLRAAMSDRNKDEQSRTLGAKKPGLDARQRRTYRTTRMLIIVVFLFAMIEFPNGLLNLLSGILDDTFVKDIYDKLGDVMDLLTMVNSSINFILYCSMSRQFRKTFVSTFVTPLTPKKLLQQRDAPTAAVKTCNL
ncbi:hypothetical protein HELRODRAFT_160033 [Helobdella robusta]|uniref:G-protein coupled receptors family 1 profile domain-containing protein n=1 Tax=Helobdella robusta TaxID=6412 RepID=T1EPP4_HELRO|nr:hypothetical protein HELRODRAFT_160033 [Helobdella robusta]ESO05935.1 hypothetical protein HELRODRAFT_160033 [Helobdella robusta]